MPRPSHSSRFCHPHNIGKEYRTLSYSLCSFLHFPVTSFLLGTNILLNTLFSNTPNFFFCSACNSSGLSTQK
jgi:hypothetical protein